MRRAGLSIATVLLLLAAAAPATATDRDIVDTCGGSPSAGFTDVTAANVHDERIDCIKHLAITTGKTATTYDPSGSLRRDQLASFLDRTLEAGGDALPDATTDWFDDDSGNTHEAAINRLAEAGIVSTSTRSFGPAARPSRAEMSRLVVAALEWAGALGTEDPPDFFTDDQGHPDELAVNRLTHAGVVTGKGDGTFDPDADLRRDQMATFLARAVDALSNGPGSHQHCRIHEPDPRFDSSWYTQQCEVFGIAVVGSADVAPEALTETVEVIIGMLGERPAVHTQMASTGFYLILLGEEEGQTDPPEYRWLKDDPDTNWDERARGLGGFDYASAGEENVLCRPSDRYSGESILVHEFAHSILDAGLEPTDPGFDARVRAAYADALAAGKWQGSYAAESYHEYWAEGVQSWFDTNLESPPIHNHVDTRDELRDYDRALYDLVAEGLGGSWRYACP